MAIDGVAIRAVRRPSGSEVWRTTGVVLVAFVSLLMTVVSGCGGSGESDSLGERAVLRIGAIPDQEPERLQRTYRLLSDYLEGELGVDVEYVPVSSYEGAVSAFRVGDLDLVWFGGLTGVQARLEVPGAEAIVQRDIDAKFRSVFIASRGSGLKELGELSDLSAVAGHSLTFGSESSTSGRLMPQMFLSEAGVDAKVDLKGKPGFSGSHDATIELVAAGTYEVGALNSQVWDDRVAESAVDLTKVQEILRTPTYFDYHWAAQPGLDGRFDREITADFTEAMLALDSADQCDRKVLKLFGARSFVRTKNANYTEIETIGRAVGLIR